MKSTTIYRSLFGLFFLLCYTISFSQTVTRQYIDSTFNKMDTNYKQKRDVFNVINGVPFDTLQLDTELAMYDLKHLIEMQFQTCEEISITHCRSDVAIILFAYNQKNKKKREAWKSAKQLFNYKSDKPVLLIDNSIIDPKTSKEKFNSFRLKDIMYIDTAQKGNWRQIRIWTAN